MSDVSAAWEAWLDAPSGDEATNKALADAVAASGDGPSVLFGALSRAITDAAQDVATDDR